MSSLHTCGDPSTSLVSSEASIHIYIDSDIDSKLRLHHRQRKKRRKHGREGRTVESFEDHQPPHRILIEPCTYWLASFRACYNLCMQLQSMLHRICIFWDTGGCTDSSGVRILEYTLDRGHDILSIWTSFILSRLWIYLQFWVVGLIHKSIVHSGRPLLI